MPYNRSINISIVGFYEIIKKDDIIEVWFRFIEDAIAYKKRIKGYVLLREIEKTKKNNYKYKRVYQKK